MTSDAEHGAEVGSLAHATQLLTKIMLSQQRQIEGLTDIISVLLDQPEIMPDQLEQIRGLLAEIRAPRHSAPEPNQPMARAHLRVVRPGT